MPYMGGYNPAIAAAAMAAAKKKNALQERLDAEADVEQKRGAGYDTQAGESRNRFLEVLGGGQDALNESIKSAVAAGMPGLMGELQGAREGAIRRGVDTGGLGTSYEGDIFSAFQKNIANAAGGQAMNLYGTRLQGYGDIYGGDTNLAEGSRNRYLDILAGNRDAEIARRNAKNAGKKSGLFGLGIGGIL